MINFDPEQKIDSKLPDFAGVSFTIHQLTEGKRLRVRLTLADANARLRDLMVEKAEADAKPEAERPPLYARILADMQDLINDRINPVWVRHLLVSVEGLTIRGQSVTPDLLIESGPRPLYAEIAQTVREQAGLTDGERGKSELPITSTALADGQTVNTSAAAAGQ